jgi:poly(hydroxyalkanoate) depolymerase family esterase
MPRKLSTLFFSTARKVARMQRKAIRAGMPGLFDVGVPKRSRTRPDARDARKAAGVVPTPRKAPAPGVPQEFDPGAFAGTWSARTYRTPPVPGTWPVRLSYFVYRPPRLRKGGPMLVMLHGCEQSAVDFAAGTRMHRLADREGLVLVYPQQSPRGQRHRCWHWYQPDAAHGYAEADAIAGVAREVAADAAVDPARVYIAGLSAGASMAALVALRHPHDFAALGMHSGAVLGSARNASEGLRAMRHGARVPPEQAVAALLAGDGGFPGMPAIILQGERDTVVHPGNGRQLLAQLAWVNGLRVDDAAPAQPRAAGTEGHYRQVDVPAKRGAVVTLCELPNVGHAWSGGDGRVRFHARHGPDASRLMWQFFRTRRRLPAPAVEE